MPAETLKEYLIKLGWDVNEVGFDRAMNKVGDFEVKSKSLFGRIANHTIKSSALVFSFISTVDTAIVNLFSSVAKADLATERFARRMWTTENNARSFLSALDAMGGSSYEDIFWMTPEEYANFMDLRSTAASLTAPAELNNTLRQIRDIQHEFDRLKVIANYASQWVAYYLGEYLGEDITNIHDLMARFNDWLMSNLPSITDKIARFLANVYNLGKAAAWAVSNLLELLAKLWGSMSGGARATVAFGAGLLALLKTGPIGMFMAAILALLLLLEDFYGYLHGKDSLFGDFWEKLINWKEDNSGLLSGIGEDLDGILSSIWNIIVKGGELFGKFVGWADSVGILRNAFELLKAVLLVIDTTLGAINTGLDKLLGKEGDTSKTDTYTEKMGKLIDNVEKNIEKNDDSIGGQIGTAWGKFVQGTMRMLTPNPLDPDLWPNGGPTIFGKDLLRDNPYLNTNVSGGYSGVDAVTGAAPSVVYSDQYDIDIHVDSPEKGSRAASDTVKRIQNNEKRINQLK